MFRGFSWTLLQVILIMLLLLTLSTVLPLTQVFAEQAKRYSMQTTTLIEIRPIKDHTTTLEIDQARIFNPGSNLYFEDQFFNESDVKRLLEISHVDRVIRGLEIKPKIFLGYEKCLNTSQASEIVEWFIEYQARYYNISIQKTRERLLETASRANMTLEEYVLNISKAWLSIMPTILGIDLDATDGVLTYFNDVIQGRFLKGKNEILLTIDYTRPIIIESDRALPCSGKAIVGDMVEIMYMNDEKPLTNLYESYRVRLVGILSPYKRLGGVASLDFVLEMARDQLKEANSIILDKLPLYTVLYVKVDKPENVMDVANEIMDMYPNAGVYYSGYTASLAGELIKSLEANYRLTTYILIGISIALISVARGLEALKSKRDIGLLKTLGWSDKEILLLTIIIASIVGLSAGVLSSISLVILKPYIINFIKPSIPPTGNVATYNVKKIIEYLVDDIPPNHILILTPLLGTVISLAASIISIVLYLRMSPDNVLRGV